MKILVLGFFEDFFSFFSFFGNKMLFLLVEEGKQNLWDWIFAKIEPKTGSYILVLQLFFAGGIEDQQKSPWLQEKIWLYKLFQLRHIFTVCLAHNPFKSDQNNWCQDYSWVSMFNFLIFFSSLQRMNWKISWREEEGWMCLFSSRELQI